MPMNELISIAKKLHLAKACQAGRETLRDIVVPGLPPQAPPNEVSAASFFAQQEASAEVPLCREHGRFNRAAMRRHALKVSKQSRSGKFTRVSEEFLNDRQAAIECAFRRLLAEVPNAPLGQVDSGDEKFLTGEGRRQLVANFNRWIANEIHSAVNKTRTGKTL